MAHALHQVGRVSLLIDTQGRLFSASSPRALFDWKHQLERRHLHTLPQEYGEGWHAPGVQADEAALFGMVDGYDYVMFDSAWGNADLVLLPAATHTMVMDVRLTGESMLHAYAVLKTLSRSGAAFSAGLLGDAAACERLQEACTQFLDPSCFQAVYSVAREDDAFAALAVRMTGEETGLTARYKTGNT